MRPKSDNSDDSSTRYHIMRFVFQLSLGNYRGPGNYKGAPQCQRRSPIPSKHPAINTQQGETSALTHWMRMHVAMHMYH